MPSGLRFPMPQKPPPLISRELLELYPTRETKIARIREVEKRLEKMELSDETNDPILIEGSAERALAD